MVFSILGISLLYSAYAQSSDYEQALAANELVRVGLSLTEQSITSNDFDSAAKYSKFSSDSLSDSLAAFREQNISVDDLHLTLLDIHTKIQTGATQESIKSDIANAKKYTDNITPSSNPVVISMILSSFDQTYQNAISQNDPALLALSEELLQKSIELFNANTSFDSRQKGELDSFFAELDSQVSQKKDFVPVGKLVTTIQRDLTGTDTVSTDQSNLYNVIRGLYQQLLVELQNNNYDKAEELGIAAYLDNFEYLEADIEIVDEGLLHTMEINMREELRTMIKEGKSYDEISTFLNDPILKDLDKAEGLVANLKKSDAAPIITTEKMLKEKGDATETQKSGVRAEIDFIRDTLETMLLQYKEGNYQAAFTSARTAYLDSYEHVEIPLRTIDPDFTLQVELQFAELRKLINEKADFSLVQEAAIQVRRSLDESERLVTGTGQLAPGIAFTSSFAVIFREGLESVLILGAILTYLEASRNTKYKKFVYYGVVIAIAATAVTWAVASYIITISGANRELIEAIAALSATAVLFYVSFWILNKIEHKKWMEFVKAKVWQASTTGGVAVFVMLSFFTVYREGFETVLFYEAMFGFAKYMELYVGLGFVAGMATLLAVYYITRRIGKRLPLKMLFGLTMGVGAYLSIAFLGNAIRELQTLDILPFTSLLGTIPRLDINMAKMTGIYPTLETLIGQIILLGVYLFAASYVLVIRPKREEKIATMRKSRKEVDEFETH